MKKIIKMLYEGKIDPSGYVSPDNPEYQNIMDQEKEILDYLRQKLAEEDTERLNDLHTLSVDSTFQYAYAYFSYAFKLGMRLACEVFMDDRIFMEQDKRSSANLPITDSND